MKTKVITLRIEIPLDSEQAKKWARQQPFIEETVNEIYNEKIKFMLKNKSGEYKSGDVFGRFELKINDLEDSVLQAVKEMNICYACKKTTNKRNSQDKSAL